MVIAGSLLQNNHTSGRRFAACTLDNAHGAISTTWVTCCSTLALSARRECCSFGRTALLLVGYSKSQIDDSQKTNYTLKLTNTKSSSSFFAKPGHLNVFHLVYLTLSLIVSLVR